MCSWSLTAPQRLLLEMAGVAIRRLDVNDRVEQVLRIEEEAKRRRVTVDERGHRAFLLVQPRERLVPLAGDRLQLIVDAQLPLLLRLADALERFRLGRALVRRARAREFVCVCNL